MAMFQCGTCSDTYTGRVPEIMRASRDHVCKPRPAVPQERTEAPNGVVPVGVQRAGIRRRRRRRKLATA